MPFMFDRRVPEKCLDRVLPGGSYRWLVELAQADRAITDIQLWRKPGSTLAGGACRVTLYVGLSAVVGINVTRSGSRVALATHATYRRLGSFDPRWSVGQPVEHLADEGEAISAFVRECIDHIVEGGRHLNEGAVHAALASVSKGGFRTAAREVSVAFSSTAERQKWLAVAAQRYVAALASALAPSWGWPPTSALGTGCDFIGIDDDGRLLAIEAKPANAKAGLDRSPLQVALYADLLRDWFDTTEGAAFIVDGMLAQRVAVGLTSAGPTLAKDPPVVPVLAIGTGAVAPTHLERARHLAAALAPARRAGVDPLEIWILDANGSCADCEIIA